MQKMTIARPINSTINASSRNGYSYKRTPGQLDSHLIQKAIKLLGLDSLDKKSKEKISEFI